MTSLEDGNAKKAMNNTPVLDFGARFSEEALERIVERTEGYPYFL